MSAARITRPPARRSLILLFVLALASFVAAGCGSEDDDGKEGGGGGEGTSGIVGRSGPLAWLPTDTWLVASANADPAVLDQAVGTLGRLPIWSLAESFLPASDGTGLRKELLTEVARNADGKPKVTAADLEQAFGNRAGLAITDNDFEVLSRLTNDSDGDGKSQKNPPIAIWLDVDDEDEADRVLGALMTGTATSAEHEGREYKIQKTDDEDFVWTVDDGVAIITTGEQQMRRLIDTRESDDSIAGDVEARAAIEQGIGDAALGFAIATDPVLELIPDVVKDQGALKGDDLTSLRQLVKTKAVDGLVADWLAGSVTIDEVGLRIKGTWSNPRAIADATPGTRELTERLPGGSALAYGGVTSGQELGRIQAAWAEAKDRYDIDLRQLGTQCLPGSAWVCDIGVELLATVLEDDQLADALEDAGPMATVSTQNLDASLFASLAAQSTPTTRSAQPAAGKRPSQRTTEIVTSNSNISYSMSAKLKQALAAGGITATVTDEGRTANLKVRAASPAGRELAAAFKDPVTGAALVAAFGTLGLDPRTLLTPAGLTVKGDQVDDLLVYGFPQDVPSDAAKSLAGEADQLKDDDDYGSTVKLAAPPSNVGTYGYIDLTSYVDSILSGIGESSPQAKQLNSTVTNNLSDIPGILFWTARDENAGEDVGTFEMVVPIEE